MTARVARHARPGALDKAALKDLAEDLEGSVDDLGQSPSGFGLAMDETLTLFQARAVLDPDAAELETWEAAVSAMQVGTAAFMAAQATDGVVERRIMDEVRTIAATGPQFYANAGNWLTTLWFVVICRDQERMDAMCQVPVGLLRASGAHGDEYVYHWVDALQTYWLERPGLVEKMQAAITASYPEIATIAPRDLLQNVLYQPINLFSHFLRKDHEGFNAALVEALELHKTYWTATAERVADLNGVIALGPLAIACLAYDAGFPIEVESEYLPKELLERSWVGEFET
ncbi:immunity 49 family protein [Streptomyces tailanensis]|uniref:immunity 49 family protein n=1 Tax=Streptomyces tailanensis TaxID=2569858 RepID=UPI00122E694F|nr:immunity 49 family protein [Streptomyces tailanensis]